MVTKLLLMLSVVSSTALQAQPQAPAALSVATAAPQQSAAEPRQPRLRFKSSGPTCMCGNELTGKDLTAIQEKAPVKSEKR